MANVTTTNHSNSAYTRAEKLLHFPDYRKGQVSNDYSNLGPSEARDPYAGFTKVFIMPSSQSEYTSVGFHGASSGKVSVANHGKIGDILRDTHAQSRVVDNVMNFFKYKEQPATEIPAPKHAQYSDGILYNNKVKSQDTSLMSLTLKPTVE